MVEEIIEYVSQSYGLRYFLAFFTCFMYWVLHKVTYGWHSEYDEGDALITGVAGMFYPVTLPFIILILLWALIKKAWSWNQNIVER